MATTTQLTITKTWQKISDSDCTVQSVYSYEQFKFASGLTAPADGAGLLIQINEPVNFSYKAPIWCRLINPSATTAVINIIK